METCMHDMPSGQKKLGAKRRFHKEMPFHLMLLPGVVLTAIFCYVPMFGIVIAFQKFIPAKGLFGNQLWVGLQNFDYLFKLPDIWLIIRNTVCISLAKTFFGLVVPIITAIMLNEIRQWGLRKSIQTIIYLPHFLSWIVVASMMIDILSPTDGIVNMLLSKFGLPSIYFLGDKNWFPVTMVVSDIWKEFGYGSIIYLAAIMGVDSSLFEAAKIDGANKMRQIWHVLLPGIRMVVVLMALLGLGNVLSGGFDQIFNLLNNQVLETGEILDTLIYKLSFGISSNFSLSTAAGLFKSVISMVLISLAYFLSYKFADYRMF